MKILLFLLALNFSITTILADSTKIPLMPKTTVWKDLGNDLVIFATDWGSFLTCPCELMVKI
jgi:hypothetical protein